MVCGGFSVVFGFAVWLWFRVGGWLRPLFGELVF